MELFGKIGGRLPRERRIGRADALPLPAMAGGAGDQAACRIAFMVEAKGLGGRFTGIPGRQRGIIRGDGGPFGGAEAGGDPTHLRVDAAAVGISDELALQIPPVQAGQPRRAGTVAAPVEAMASETGVGGAGLRAAEGDQFAARREPADGCRVRGGAPPEKGCGGEHGTRGERAALRHDIGATTRIPARFPRFPKLKPASLLPVLMLTVACKQPPDERRSMPLADSQQALAAIERAGCGACHDIPGIGWPQGKVGPALDGLATRALIAGRLPNRPDVLAAYIRNAPALMPGSAMPAMPVSPGEARDIAQYLYDQGAR